ncbi:MAG: hypothetical protein MUE71_10865 [Chitinophagaceae bacterium]|nr:hypothetical protein [Chitinophagaceae bacterium]
MKTRYLFLAISWLCFPFWLFSQETSASESHEPFKKTHSLSLAIGHAHVFDGRDAEGNKKVLALPMWAFDYNFQFSPKWGIGLHTDLITETFEVEKHLENGGEGEVVERSTPIAPAIMGVFKPTHHWGFGLGLGGEFAKEENYVLTRAGVEYVAEIGNGLEVFGAIQYDFRWDAYDTWTIGLGISKALGKRHKSTVHKE